MAFRLYIWHMQILPLGELPTGSYLMVLNSCVDFLPSSLSLLPLTYIACLFYIRHRKFWRRGSWPRGYCIIKEIISTQNFAIIYKDRSAIRKVKSTYCGSLEMKAWRTTPTKLRKLNFVSASRISPPKSLSCVRIQQDSGRKKKICGLEICGFSTCSSYVIVLSFWSCPILFNTIYLQC